ncbi:hypothetical protein HPB51_013403 [Rhipicephalus microplus]|uniref:Uncharacterized protein n=1 Tax=Rhipicephalus microplus TaxID=6941 RepID=A0A9J6F4I1_RHIMP|nr:hypothetical protein HPB51_013403 [Rhipicephalus microplus]
MSDRHAATQVKLSGQWNDGAQWVEGASPSRKPVRKQRRASYFRCRLGWRKKENEPPDPQAHPQMSPMATSTAASGHPTDDRERLGNTLRMGERARARSTPSSAAPGSQASSSKAGKMSRSGKGSISIETPFPFVESKQQMRRHQQQPQQHSSSKPASADSKSNVQIPVHSSEVTKKTTRQPLQLPQHDHHTRELSSRQHRDSHLDQYSATGSTSSNSLRYMWLHKLRAFWSTAGIKHATEEEPHEGNASCPDPETRAMPTRPEQGQADREVRGTGLPSSEMSDCPLGRNAPTHSLVPTNVAPATNDDRRDGGKDDAEVAFVFDALADRLDHAAEAFVAAAAGVVTELAVAIPGADSEDNSVTPSTSSVSVAVHGGRAMASCPTGGAAVVTTFDDNVAAVVPTNVPKKGDHRSEKEAQDNEASGITQSRKRAGKSKEKRAKKKQEIRKSFGSSSRSSRRTSGRSSGHQTPRLSNKGDLQAEALVPIIVPAAQQEQHDLKGAVSNPLRSTRECEGPGVNDTGVINSTTTTNLTRQEFSGQIVPFETCLLDKPEKQKRAVEPRCPVVPPELNTPRGSAAQPEGTIKKAPGFTREKEPGNLRNKGSQLSKSSLRKSHVADREKANNASPKKGTARATKAEPQERCAKKKTSDQHVGSPRSLLVKKEGKPVPPIDVKVRLEEPKRGDAGEVTTTSMPRVVAEHSSNISESPKPTAVTSLVEREDSKSTASGTSLVQSTETLVECRQENLSAPSTGLLRHSSEALSLVTRSEPRRSLQSVVSFREEVKEIDNETTTTVKE